MSIFYSKETLRTKKLSTSILITTMIIKWNVALILWILQNMRGQPVLLNLALAVFSYQLWSTVVLHALVLVWGESGHQGEREGICAYCAPLSSHWHEAACSFVGECTYFQRAGRIDGSSCRIVWGKARGKKWMPARHPALGRLLCFTQRFNCAKHRFMCLVLCCVYIYMHFVFKH